MSDWLHRVDGVLHAEGIALPALAERHGTPAWIYSAAAIRGAWRQFADAAAGRDVLVCYAVKANPTLAIIDLLAREGAGFDIVSGGELARVVAAGGDPGKVVFSGVGKADWEIRDALLAGIGCFNVESESELVRIDAVAGRLGRRAPVSMRVNPDVDARTHPYISTGLTKNKFGIAHAQALAAYRAARALPNLEVTGIDCHIGSQITEVAPFLAALDKLLELVDALAAEGIEIGHLDLGGGLGIRYTDETPPSPGEMLGAIFERLDAHPRGRRLRVMFEIGRALVGNAGVLLTRVEYLKRNQARRFAIVDAAMNDLIRPALYQSHHEMVPVVERDLPAEVYDVVGPVCESGDFLGRDRALAIAEGDLVAILSAGAYGMSQSSNYNTRPRAVELLVDGTRVHVARERETVPQLFALEHRLPAA